MGGLMGGMKRRPIPGAPKLTVMLEVTLSVPSGAKTPGEYLDYQLEQLVSHVARDGGESVLTVAPQTITLEWPGGAA